MSVNELKVLPEVRIGHVGSVLVSVWHSQASLSGLKALAEAQRELIKRHGKITNLSLVVKVPQPPGPEAKEWIKQTDAEFKESTLGSVVVVLERGLAAIIVRSFLAAASLISSNQMQVVKTLAEATTAVKGIAKQDLAVINDAALAQKLEAFVALGPAA